MTYAQRTAQQYDVGGALIGDVDPVTRVSFYTEFKQLPIHSSKWLRGMFGAGGSSKSPMAVAEPDWVLSGRLAKGAHSSNGAMWDISGDGWLRLGISSKSTKSGNLFLRLHSNNGTTIEGRYSKWAATKFFTEDQPEMDVLIKTSATAGHVTGCFLMVGLVLTHVYDVATDADQVKFWFNPTTSATNLYVADSVGGTDTLTDTGVDLAVSTVYRLQLRVQSDRTVKCYVNGALVHTTGALTTAINLRPHVGIKLHTATVARPYLNVGYIRMSKVRA